MLLSIILTGCSSNKIEGNYVAEYWYQLSIVNDTWTFTNVAAGGAWTCTYTLDGDMIHFEHARSDGKVAKEEESTMRTLRQWNMTGVFM